MAHYNNKRSNANTENIKVRDLSTSGFDLSYKTKDSGRIGFRELVGYEYVLSGDKMRLSTAADLQYQPTASPMLPAMDMRIEHVFVPFRNINNDYEDTLSYVKGEAWNMTDYPHVTLSQLWNELKFTSGSLFTYTKAALPGITGSLFRQRIAQSMNALRSKLSLYYIGDYADHLQNHLFRITAGWDELAGDARVDLYLQVCYSFIQYFLGVGSALDKLNAPIIKLSDLSPFEGSATPSSLIEDFANTHDAPIAVMPLRALYADWFETTRDANLEPAKTLPRYHKLGNSIESIEQILYCYLVPRYALLGKDIYTTAQIDSPYRHVIAPIIQDDFDLNVVGDGSDVNRMQLQNGVVLNDNNSLRNIIGNNYGTLRNYMDNADINAFGLDLVALKRAKQAKDWLMRGHVFGDEYQDYVLAQYGVKIEDSRINKPLYLGGYSQEVNINQTVNPTATSEMPAGAKNCTMTSGGTTESFDFYSSENGIVLTWLYIAPAVTYEPYEVRNTICKGIDFPTPVFSNDSEELSSVCEMARNLASTDTLGLPFGRHPYAHAWRSRVDENHGQFLAEYKPYTFMRVFESAPNLNAAFIHTHVNLDFMVDTDSFNPIWFGTISHNNFVERKLPIVTDEC